MKNDALDNLGIVINNKMSNKPYISLDLSYLIIINHVDTEINIDANINVLLNRSDLYVNIFLIKFHTCLISMSIV